MLVGGALVNALAFSGSNYLFTILRSSGVNFAGKVMLLRRPGMLTLQCRNMRRSPGTTSTPWGPSPSSPTFITRVTARKTARSPSSFWGWPRPAWWPTDSPSNPCFIARLNFFDVGNMLAMLADELYLTMLEVGHAARRRPLAHTMIDIAQKSLELWRQEELAAIRFAAGVMAGPTNFRATAGQLPEPVASACWRLVRLLEYLSSNGRQ